MSSYAAFFVARYDGTVLARQETSPSGENSRLYLPGCRFKCSIGLRPTIEWLLEEQMGVQTEGGGERQGERQEEQSVRGIVLLLGEENPFGSEPDVLYLIEAGASIRDALKMREMVSVVWVEPSALVEPHRMLVGLYDEAINATGNDRCFRHELADPLEKLARGVPFLERIPYRPRLSLSPARVDLPVEPMKKA